MWRDKLVHHLRKLKVQIFQFSFHHILGLLPNVAGTWRIFASDQYLLQKWTFIFKAIGRNVRTWGSFLSPGWKLPNGFKAGGRGSLQTDSLRWPHVEGKRAFIPWACWASRKALMGSVQPPQSTQQITELPQGTGALGTVSRPRQHWHPGSSRVLGVVLPLWAQMPAGEPGRDFNSLFVLLWLSSDTRGPNKGVKTVELHVICTNCAWKQRDNWKF